VRHAERQLAEATARVIATAEEMRLPDAPEKLVTPRAIRTLARAFVELRDQVRSLHDRVDLTDPHDPIGVALTEIGLARRPRDWTHGKPRLVRPPLKIDQIAQMSVDQLLGLYCRVMDEVELVFVKYGSYVLRSWDGMDGCWTDVTGDVDREKALRCWAECTDGGTRRVSYDEIDYYRIFPGGTRMIWDGSDGKEMHR
jgi:hypothetical protein